MIILCFINIVFNFIGFVCELFYRACYAEKKSQALSFSVHSSSETTISTHVAGSFGICFYIITWHTCTSVIEVFLFIHWLLFLPTELPIVYHTPFYVHIFHFHCLLGVIAITGIMEIFNISMECFISAIHQLSL